MKIAINKCYGGFGLSKAAYEALGLEWNGYGYVYNKTFDIESDDDYAYRTNSRLIDVIETLGEEESSGDTAAIVIVDIPDDIEWEITEYDGIETVREVHRS